MNNTNPSTNSTNMMIAMIPQGLSNQEVTYWSSAEEDTCAMISLASNNILYTLQGSVIMDPCSTANITND